MSAPELADRHLLALEGLSRSAIESVFELAERYRPYVVNDGDQPCTALSRRGLALLFFEDSTRTRVSFTRAAQLMGADIVTWTAKGSSASKGESTIDTARNIEAMGYEAFVVRHHRGGGTKKVAEHVKVPVINAGDGRHEHPTQGLLDAMTMVRHFGGSIEGRHIGIVGDIANSRVARSNIHVLQTLGAKVTVVGPPTLCPESLASMGASVTWDLDPLLPHLDVLMALRIQFERIGAQAFPSAREYRAGYGVTAARVERLPEHAVILHPGPINRGLELDDDVADCDRALILAQVTNGVAIRMAVLHRAFGLAD